VDTHFYNRLIGYLVTCLGKFGWLLSWWLLSCLCPLIDVLRNVLIANSLLDAYFP